MAKQKSADQTEKPTPKRLKDARKDGDVPKSKELTATAGVLCWFILVWLALGFAWQRLAALFTQVFSAVGEVGRGPMPALWIPALRTLVLICLPLLLAAAAIGLLVELLQVGGIFAPKRVSPNTGRLNPMEGLRQESTDGALRTTAVSPG